MAAIKKQRTSAGESRHTQREMARLLARSGIVLSDAQLKQLWSYHCLLRKHNPELNLTRIHNFENMVLKLYVDSILPGTLVDLPSPLLDLGTGPGMPGIPLAIAFPELTVLLAEGRGKRVSFLNTAVQELGLSSASVIGRAIAPDFQEPVAGVITRAVETMAATLERVSGCLSSGGKVLFMKGPACDNEIADAQEKFGARFRLTDDLAYSIAHTPHRRRLVIFERLDASRRQRKAAAMNRHRVHVIESESNSRFKELKKLLAGRGVKKQNLALVAGVKPVNEALAAFPDQCRAWITRQDQAPPPENAPAHLAWEQLAPALFETLDIFGTRSPLLLFEPAPMGVWRPDEGFSPGCTLLLPFQDPENAGAAIRSAVAFGAAKIVLLAECAHPFHPKTIRASAGAVLHAPLFEGPSLKDLPDDLPIVPLSMEGTPIDGFAFPAAFGLLAGIEGPGLPDAWRRRAVSIPTTKDVESLNAATAIAVALYAWSRAGK